MVPWVFLVDPGSGGVKNTHDPANLRKKAVVKRMRAAVTQVRQKRLRVDGWRRWNGAEMRVNGPVRRGNGGVLRRNDGSDGRDGRDGVMA